MSNYLQDLILDYERDLMGSIYTFLLSDGETISFEIKRSNVPHLLGIKRLQLRQVQGKYANYIYSMLKDGTLTLEHVVSVPNHKEVYKKIMNFQYISAMLHSGNIVKIVKRIGRLNSSYLFYLDHRPQEIIHLGIGRDADENWYPESLLVLQRNATAYIDGQVPVDIVKFDVTARERPISASKE